MRTVKIEKIEYETFKRVRGLLYANIPYALISNTYLDDLKTAFFVFWDLAYVPESLKKYIMELHDPGKFAAMNKNIGDILA